MNLLGFAAIFAIARSAAWLKSAPWSTGAEQAASRSDRTSRSRLAHATSGASRCACGPIRPRSQPMRSDADRPGAARPNTRFLRQGRSCSDLPLALGARAVVGGRARRARVRSGPALPRPGRRLSGPAAGRLGRSFGASGSRVLPRLDAIRRRRHERRGDGARNVGSRESCWLRRTAPGIRGRFQGSPSHYRDEFAFVRAVLDDVEARFPIDKRRLWASGFSQGGSMVWYAACFLGDRFAAFVPVAGDFWEPLPPNCPSGPASIRHIHGLADETFPTSGRAVAEHSHQGRSLAGLGALAANRRLHSPAGSGRHRPGHDLSDLGRSELFEPPRTGALPPRWRTRVQR